MVKILGKLCLLLGLLPALSQAFQTTASPGWYGVYLPVTLPSLVRGSDRIFVGQVEKVVLPQIVGDDQVISLRVEYVIRGFDYIDSVVTIHQSGDLVTSIQVGERVLWFLNRDNADGYSIPFAFTSGDFRIDTNEQTLSQNGNTGLWEDDGDLWETGECSRTRFSNSLDRAGLGNRTKLKYLRWADSGYRAQSYPLLFLLAASVSCLPDKDFRRLKSEAQTRPYRFTFDHPRQYL